MTSTQGHLSKSVAALLRWGFLSRGAQPSVAPFLRRFLGTFLAFLLGISISATTLADGARDNDPSNVRQIPPPGIEVPAADRNRLEDQLAELQSQITDLRNRDDTLIRSLLPDVEIFARAVDQALRFNEMFAEAGIKRAETLLKEGAARAQQLAAGDAPWTRQKGLVVRGFRSRLDETVQPYGLVIPDSYTSQTPGRYRCDVWLHGRGERSVELQFIHSRMTNPGPYQPEDTIVLHPFGRYSNAFKFAGEVDVLEALEHAKLQYRIDEDRISIRGFSMGGAGCWQFAVHYADRWFAANPGAGFSETPQFLRSFQGEQLSPTWWEQTLWQWYDCPGWVANLANCPTIAYSGELDVQKQAADVMAEAYNGYFGIGEDGPELLHLIGPGVAHKIHSGTKLEIDRRMQSLAKSGRDTFPCELTWSSPMLRYNNCRILTVNELADHWRPAEVKLRTEDGLNRLFIDVSNVLDFSIELPPGTVRLDSWAEDKGYLDLYVSSWQRDGFDAVLYAGMPTGPGYGDLPRTKSDRSWSCRIFYDRDRHRWRYGTPPWEGELRKRHGLSGPIDDAFMDSFVFVRPSGECRQPAVEKWTKAEFEHAVTHWRQQMRGDARVKADADISEEDIARHNLILWGDPASNSVLARVMKDLPIQWTESEIIVGERRFDAARHAPILIFPNPLNPKKYVVLNSSFTYREYDYLNNARQTPKLPDWAVVDLRTPPDSRWPGKIVDADFFDEKWELQAPHEERVRAKQ